MSFAIPVFKSGFRPFFLLGSLYGLVLMIIWLPLLTGQLAWITSSTHFLLWHQHEMLFGFTAAIVCGFILTALPSWAKSDEIDNGKLALLTLTWLAGRIIFFAGNLVPQPVIVILDLAFPVVFLAIVGPGLLRVQNKFYLLIFPFMATFFLANLLFHQGMLNSDFILAGKGIRLAVYSIIFHCVIVGGFLTPIFTETALQRSGQKCHFPSRKLWDWLSLCSIPLLALSDILEFDPLWRGTIAFASVFIHAMRMHSWHSLRILDKPELWIMHLGYAWLIIAFALRGMEDVGLLNATGVWVHAFTVGTLGSLMLGFMTRIVLRHTGRPMRAHPLMIGGFYLMFAAALIRVYAALVETNSTVLLISALLWALPFALYLIVYGKMLIKPSLPRKKANEPLRNSASDG